MRYNFQHKVHCNFKRTKFFEGSSAVPQTLRLTLPEKENLKFQENYNSQENGNFEKKFKFSTKFKI